VRFLPSGSKLWEGADCRYRRVADVELCGNGKLERLSAKKEKGHKEEFAGFSPPAGAVPGTIPWDQLYESLASLMAMPVYEKDLPSLSKLRRRSLSPMCGHRRIFIMRNLSTDRQGLLARMTHAMLTAVRTARASISRTISASVTGTLNCRSPPTGAQPNVPTRTAPAGSPTPASS